MSASSIRASLSALLIVGSAAAQTAADRPRALTELQPISAPSPRQLDPQFKLTANAWKYDEALAALRRHPDNAYLQYVVLQLARNGGKIDDLRKEGFFATRRQERRADLFSLFTGVHAIQESLQLDTMLPPTEAPEAALPAVAADGPNPPAIRFVQQTSSRDIQEIVSAKVVRNGQVIEEKQTLVRKVLLTTTKEVVLTQAQAAMVDLAKEPRWLMCSTIVPFASFPASATWCVCELPPPHLSAVSLVANKAGAKEAGAKEAGATPTVTPKKIPLDGIAGPSTRSHPWTKLLAGREPQVSDLARCIPEDFYFVECRSPGKLLDIAAAGQEWAGYLFPQAGADATDARVRQRWQRQLVLETPELLRPLFDRVIGRMAITGSDVHLNEGSDVTMLFELKEPALFHAHVERSLATAQKQHPAATRASGEILGTRYVGLTTPDRLLSVYAAEPRPGLHVRSNSKVALGRVLEAIQGRTAQGKAVRTLGGTDEFRYIRTLWTDSAAEEDVFVYLSDAFVRHMVGPQLRIAERRRLICYNHLRMIGHAAQLYRTQFGVAPGNLAALAQTGCSPGEFNDGELKCPCGGAYDLSPDGTMGVCSVHGTIAFLTPCCELPVKNADQEEAAAYKAFIDDYNEYWRTYFDPIVIRLRHDAKKLRVETMILPLIDNSIYTEVARALGGPPANLGTQPVAKRNLFSMNLNFHREELLRHLQEWQQPEVPTPLLPGAVAAVNPSAGFPGALPWETLPTLAKGPDEINVLADTDFAMIRLAAKTDAFLKRGIRSQVGVHLYDAPLMFDINYSEGLAGLFRPRSQDAIYAYIGLMGAGFFAPYYVTLDVQDPKVVDDFLAELERYLVLQSASLSDAAEAGGMNARLRFVTMKTRAGSSMRAAEIRIGPLRYHLYWARVDDQLILTNQPYVFDDLRTAAKAPRRPADTDHRGHALIRFRPEHWNQALSGYRIGWAANNRDACVKNLGILSSTARAFDPKTALSTPASWNERRRRVLAESAKVNGLHCACPEGGSYEIAKDGKHVVCTVHGMADHPVQSDAPAEASPVVRFVRSFADLSATLTFREEGLHALVILEKR